MATNQIIRISAVAKYGRTPIFIGWGKDELPLASSTNISEEAKADFQSARASGAKFPSIPTESINCFEYASLGNATDYPGQKEDCINIRAKDESGKSVNLQLGESTILRGLAWTLDSENRWNSLSGAELFSDKTGVTSPVPLYTVFFQDQRVLSGHVCALLFKPLTLGLSNEDTVLRLTRGVIRQLLIIDESQPPNDRKGYINAAAMASKGNTPRLASLFFDMKDQHTAQKVSNLKAGGIKLLQTLGIAEVSDEVINAIKDPLPNYNIEGMSVKDLADLTAAMASLVPYRNRS